MRWGYLRLLLIQAAYSSAVSAPQTADRRPLLDFAKACDWRGGGNAGGRIESRIAECEAWLNTNEQVLKYSYSSGYFEGAPEPQRSRTLAIFEQLPADLGIDTSALEDTPESKHAVFDKLPELVNTNPRRASDFWFQQTFISLLDPKRMDNADQIIGLSSVDKNLAMTVFAALAASDLDGYMRTLHGTYGQMKWIAKLEDVDPQLVHGKFPMTHALFEMTENPTRKMKLLFCALWVGRNLGAVLNIPYDEVQKVLDDCPRTEAELFNDWGCGLAKTGRIAGLYVLLNAGSRKDLPGLEAFELYSGMTANTSSSFMPSPRSSALVGGRLTFFA